MCSAAYFRGSHAQEYDPVRIKFFSAVPHESRKGSIGRDASFLAAHQAPCVTPPVISSVRTSQKVLGMGSPCWRIVLQSSFSCSLQLFTEQPHFLPRAKPLILMSKIMNRCQIRPFLGRDTERGIRNEEISAVGMMLSQKLTTYF